MPPPTDVESQLLDATNTSAKFKDFVFDPTLAKKTKVSAASKQQQRRRRRRIRMCGMDWGGRKRGV